MHVLAGLALTLGTGAECIQLTGSTGATGSTDALDTVQRRTQGKLLFIVVIILTRFDPVGAGGVMMEDNALQKRRIIGAVGILGGNLKLGHAACGDLDAAEGHGQTVHIICQIFCGEFALYHCGENELLLQEIGLSHHCVFVIHILSSIMFQQRHYAAA